MVRIGGQSESEDRAERDPQVVMAFARVVRGRIAANKSAEEKVRAALPDNMAKILVPDSCGQFSVAVRGEAAGNARRSQAMGR